MQFKDAEVLKNIIIAYCKDHIGITLKDKEFEKMTFGLGAAECFPPIYSFDTKDMQDCLVKIIYKQLEEESPSQIDAQNSFIQQLIDYLQRLMNQANLYYASQKQNTLEDIDGSFEIVGSDDEQKCDDNLSISQDSLKQNNNQVVEEVKVNNEQQRNAYVLPQINDDYIKQNDDNLRSSSYQNYIQDKKSQSQGLSK